MSQINAAGLHYRELNDKIHSAVQKGEKEIELLNVNGQRYIGCGLRAQVKITIRGTAGNDLSAFMDGPEITVKGNAQDGVANTMSAGRIAIHGQAGDITGYAMRGGKILVKGDIGYRVGIHMKSYLDKVPVIVIGGRAGDFLGEYMAGGILIVLGITGKNPVAGNYIGTGMHGGTIYLRGRIEKYQLGKEVGMEKLSDSDWQEIKGHIEEFSHEFDIDVTGIVPEDFTKLFPYTHRPYGRIYAY